MAKKRTVGFWVIIIISLLLLAMLVMGQMMSYINYDLAVSLGLQESVNKITVIGVAINKAFGVGDTIIYLPILVLGLVGLWLKKRWGVFTMVGALAITAYWPMVCLFFLYFAKGIPGFKFSDYALYTIVLILITIYGLWGMWHLYKNTKEFVDK